MLRSLLFSLVLLGGCSSSVETFLWNKNCLEYPLIGSFSVGIKMSTGEIGLANSNEHAARLPEKECGGSWSVYALTATDRKYDVLYLYGTTELSPPFTF